MGIGISLLKFVGIPAAVIVGLGLALKYFQPQIKGAATQVGSSFADIVAGPIQGFVGGISNSFADFPDIQIRIPGINVSGGLFTFTQEQPVKDISGETTTTPGGEITFGPGTSFDPNTGIIEGSPPTYSNPTPTPTPTPSPTMDIIPEAQGATLTPYANKFPVTGYDQFLTLEQIQNLVPGAVGLFDYPQTNTVEFVPLDPTALKYYQSIGSPVTLSGQLYKEIKNVQDAYNAA